MHQVRLLESLIIVCETVSASSVILLEKYVRPVKNVGKGALPQWELGGVLISQTLATEHVGGQTTESVTHGQYNARPTVTFLAAERHHPLAGTKLYCLVTEAHGCEQLAQSWYSVADWPGVELATFRSRANALTTQPPSHRTSADILWCIYLSM